MKNLLLFLLGAIAVATIAATINGVQYVAIQDYNGTKLELDPRKYMITIGVEHHKTHEGELFEVSGAEADLDTGEELCFNVVVPAGKTPHVSFEVSTSAASWIYFVRSNYNTAGTALTTFNTYIGSANTSTVTANQGTTIVGGTTNRIGYSGSNNGSQRIGGVLRGDEIILYPNTTNTFQVKAVSDNTLVSGRVIWYE